MYSYALNNSFFIRDALDKQMPPIKWWHGKHPRIVSCPTPHVLPQATAACLTTSILPALRGGTRSWICCWTTAPTAGRLTAQTLTYWRWSRPGHTVAGGRLACAVPRAKLSHPSEQVHYVPRLCRCRVHHNMPRTSQQQRTHRVSGTGTSSDTRVRSSATTG